MKGGGEEKLRFFSLISGGQGKLVFTGFWRVLKRKNSLKPSTWSEDCPSMFPVVFCIFTYILFLIILWLFLNVFSYCLVWTLRATSCFVETGCLCIGSVLVFFSLNLMLGIIPRFMFKSYFEPLPCSKPMD